MMCIHKTNFKKIDILECDNRKKGNFNTCCKINWPTDQELLKMIAESNCTIVSKKLGVNYGAVSGRLKRRNLWKKW